MTSRYPALAVAGLSALVSAGTLASACSPPVRANTAVEGGTTTSPIEKTFAAGGRVRMRLSAGEYVIEPRSDDKIHVSWTVRDASEARNARAALAVEGTEARIETDGPHNGFDVKIGVPARSDLYVRLTAGELTIKAIEGHKDVSLLAGEIRIAVDKDNAYRSVDARVMAGEIQARAFGGHKGGLFRGFEWKGDGKYDLKARLSAGEIHLR
jgi:hypothetical protein